FSAEKRDETRQVAGKIGVAVPALVWEFYDKVDDNDWNGASSLYARMADSLWLDRGPLRPPAGYVQEVRRRFDLDASLAAGLPSEIWPVVTETHGAFRVFHDWDRRWLRRLSHDVIDSIPAGSIYFGGTDFGWCGISAFASSQREHPPFFVVTQDLLWGG